MNPICVGLLGIGTVGGGTWNVLLRNQEEITRRAGRGIRITKVADKDLARAEQLVAGRAAVTADAYAVVSDPDIDIVVELIGGYGVALDLVLKAIENGKHVVTANKALLATHGNEIFAAAQKKGVMVAFEAAVCGGIPIIKALREGLTANRIEWIAGIINGTSNFILSEMRDKGLAFATVLAEAQRLGYAETDPTFDIEGIDAAHKLTIMSAIAFGIPMQFDKAYTEGISRLTQEDIRYAEQLGYRIKLLGITRRTPDGIELRVHPTLIPARRLIANVEGVMNAVLVKGDAVGATLYYGAGAGAEPTASAVVADLVDVTRMHTADPEHRVPHLAFQPDQLSNVAILPMDEVVTSYYMRMRVVDRPGVLADITRILADHGVSIDAMVQKEPSEGEEQVDIIMLTHETREKQINAAIGAIENLAVVSGKVTRIRLEELGGIRPMRYVSTRGGMAPQTFTQILLGGLCPDGGLAIAERYPQIGTAELAAWRKLSYADLAYEILHRFCDDIPAEDLKALCAKTYTKSVFRTDAVTPIKTLEPGLHLLELSNGPTLAFKDMAMQLLGNLFEYVLARSGERINILGATSGDTGSSAEYALRGKRGVNVFMLSPQGKMSPFQTAQMFSLQDANIFNIAVRGVFDDCQDIVKAVNNDAVFKARQRIGAVNSINWARVAAQVVYYFRGYFAATSGLKSANDEQVAFAVPSGNFGNICAGHIARMMGLPIARLILATNENNVLDEFFRSGRYRVRPSSQVEQTSSPSMDISKASNFERFVFDLVGRDAATVNALWSKVDAGGEFDLAGTPYFAKVREYGFVSGSSSHADRLATIRRVYNDYGVMIDTHTADGLKVGLEHRQAGVPLVCLETALPVKFAETIREALGRDPDYPPGCENLESLPQRFEVMDADAGAVKEYIERHAGH